MILNRKSLRNGKKAARYYRISDFERAAGAVNVRCGKDKLERARGYLSLGSMPQGVNAAALFAAADETYCAGDDGKLYRLAEGGAFAPLSGGFCFTSPLAFCEAYNGSAYVPLFSDGIKSYVCLSGGLYPTDIPPFTAACYFYERLWAYAGGKLCFSAPLAYDDFTDGKNKGGEIALPDGRGEILALVPFDNRIYIFREYGIQRLDVRGEQTDFEITDCAAFGEYILKDTIAAGGNGVYFCTESDIYRMVGGTPSKIYGEARERYKLDALKGIYAEGRYCLLAVNGAGLKTLCLFGKDGVETICGEISDICAVQKDNRTACAYISEGEARVLAGTEPPRRIKWESEPCDLGGGARHKVLERVILRGKGFFLLHISGGRACRTLEVRFLHGKSELNVGLYGESFVFTLESDSAEAEISELSCLYTLSEGGKL